MGTGKRERSVTEGRWTPSAGGVAHGAIRGESARYVVGTCGPVEVALVAGVAICGSGGVVVVHMALRAWHRCVFTGQRIVSI